LVNSEISKFLWGPITLLFVISVGLWFSFRLKFFQFLKLKLWFLNTFGTLFRKKKHLNKNNILPKQAVFTALAGCIGTGNIIGVSTAILIGGPGALFWMWVAAILGMMTSFAENILSIKYRQKSSDGKFFGGPMLYIERGLHCKPLAILFCVACILVSFGTGNMIQSNSISNVFSDLFNFSPFATGLILCVLTFIVTFGGIKRIVKVTDKMVPFMIGFYILGGIIVILSKINMLVDTLLTVITEAFNFKSINGSLIGCTAIKAMRYGVSRGLFSNEAGLGSSPIVHAASTGKEPVMQGMWGIFQVFIDTIVICSITGLCILTSGATKTDSTDVLSVTKNAFNGTMGKFGEIFVYMPLILFAFSTIISWSYSGEKCTQYIWGEKYTKVYKLIVPLMTLLGAVINLNLLWEICDNLNVFMMIPNLLSLLFLSNKVVNLTEKFLKKNHIHS
jgi:AGCS family alanine or glycine:cation symporter